MKQSQVGQRLRELRRQRGLPLSVLARLARVGVQTLQNAEKWGIPLPRRSAERVAQVLGVPVEELLPEPQEVSQP